MLANPRQTADDLAEWIRRYFEENGPKCSAVVGLSGGKDSTVTAALCVKALGAGRVVSIFCTIQSSASLAIEQSAG